MFDCISTQDQLIKKLAKVTDLLHDRISGLEKLIDDQEEVKNTTENEWN